MITEKGQIPVDGIFGHHAGLDYGAAGTHVYVCVYDLGKDDGVGVGAGVSDGGW